MLEHANEAEVEPKSFRAVYEPLARKLSDLKSRIRVEVMEQHARDQDGIWWSWWQRLKDRFRRVRSSP